MEVLQKLSNLQNAIHFSPIRKNSYDLLKFGNDLLDNNTQYGIAARPWGKKKKHKI